MNKEQLEDDKAYIRLFNQNTKLSKRVKELEENLEHGAKVAVKTAEKLHYEQQQNKRYREWLEKIECNTSGEENLMARKALAGEDLADYEG